MSTTQARPGTATDKTDSGRGPIEGLNIYVIGLGGIAEALVRYLGLFCYGKDASNVIWLIDGDDFELENKERMGFADMGSKAYVREAEMARLLGDRVSFQAVPLYVTADNIEELIPPDEPAIICLCVDNHGTRRLVAEYCERRSAGLTLLISGGNTSVEEDADGGTTGNVLIHHKEDNRNLTNPILTHHPEIANADGEEVPSNEDPDCVTLGMGAGATQIGLTNLAVASAMVNAFYSWYVGELDYEEVFLDIVRNTVVARKRPVCCDDA